MKIIILNSFIKKLKGLLGKKEIDDNMIYLFTNCNRVHTHFMSFSITVIYLDDNLNILDYEILEPWKIGKKVNGTKNIIEGSKQLYYKLENDKELNIRMVQNG